MQAPIALQIELLLFDLGGVLLDFTGPKELGRLLREPISEPEIRARWGRCPHIRAFEIGALSPADSLRRLTFPLNETPL
jgi:hypothetical protein